MDERQAFERWYMAQCILNCIEQTDGIYCKPATRRAWAGWKAGRKALLDDVTHRIKCLPIFGDPSVGTGKVLLKDVLGELGVTK